MPRKLAKPEDQMKRQLIANIQYEAEIRSIDREGQALVTQCSEGTYRKELKIRVLLRWKNCRGLPTNLAYLFRTFSRQGW